MKKGFLGIQLNKKQQQTLLYVGVGLMLLYFIAYAAGRNRGKVRIVAGVDQSQVRPGFDPAPFAVRIGNAMHGWNNPFSAARTTLLIELNTVSDAELASIYNYYNKNISEDGITLYELIRSEYMPGATIQTVILSRMSRLGLI